MRRGPVDSGYVDELFPNTQSRNRGSEDDGGRHVGASECVHCRFEKEGTGDGQWPCFLLGRCDPDAVLE